MTDDGYDAASVIGQMAGLGADKPKPEPVSPDQLVARFCADARVQVNAAGTVRARGFCGYSGGRSHDGMLVGFDDGYEFMGQLEARGWQALPGKGDWPYVVYLAHRGELAELAIAEYCEGDLTVWRFTSRLAMKAHYAGLGDCP